MGTLMTRLGNRWQSLPPARRIALVVILFGLIGTAALWAVLGSQVTYETAFSHVKPADASPVVDKLKELQIPYQLQTELDGTTTIKVPSYLADEARVQIAGAGLLQGSGVGYEIFNQPSFGLSDYIQQIDYQRALEGELARSISQIDSVDSARVHLAIPQPHVFVSEQRDPSAAVMIGLKPGRTIDRAQAKAIVDLVVGAVEGMKPAGVVLLDTQGHLLHQGDSPGDQDPGAVGDQYQTQRTMEQDLETRLQAMLDRVVGPGHSNVQVALNLDWSQGQLTSETYSPNGQSPQIQSSQDVRDIQPAGGAASGIPGVTSNVPIYQQQLTPTAKPTGSGTPTAATSEHDEAVRNYQLSKVTETTNRQPGGIQRMSVAIAVDQSVADPSVVQQLTSMAQAASGYDAKRGDTVSVVAVPMKGLVTADKTPAAPKGPFGQSPETIQLAAMIAGPVLAVLILAVLLLRRRPRRSPAITPTEVVAINPALGSPLADPLSLPSAPDARRNLIREQVTTLAETHPALVAAVLQSWVNDEGGSRS